jgi:hypothetical protein
VPKELTPPTATLAAMTDEALAAAWEAVHENTPAGWQVGRTAYVDRFREWRMYAFDLSERPVVGKRSREWTASGQTELDCVKEMARGLAEIKVGRWPG